MKNEYREKNLVAIRYVHPVPIYYYTIWLGVGMKSILTIWPESQKIEFDGTEEIDQKYFYELMSLFLQITKDYEIFVNERKLKNQKPAAGSSGN